MSATEGGINIEVVQVVPEDFNPNEIVHEFLEALDWREVERLALAKMSWGDGSVTEKIIETLKDLARGSLS